MCASQQWTPNWSLQFSKLPPANNYSIKLLKQLDYVKYGSLDYNIQIQRVIWHGLNFIKRYFEFYLFFLLILIISRICSWKYLLCLKANIVYYKTIRSNKIFFYYVYLQGCWRLFDYGWRISIFYFFFYLLFFFIIYTFKWWNCISFCFFLIYLNSKNVFVYLLNKKLNGNAIGDHIYVYLKLNVCRTI